MIIASIANVQTAMPVPIQNSETGKRGASDGAQFADVFNASAPTSAADFENQIADIVTDIRTELDAMRGNTQSARDDFMDLMEKIDTPFGFLVAQLDELRALNVQAKRTLQSAVESGEQITKLQALRDTMAELEAAIASLEQQIEVKVQRSVLEA